MNKGLLGSFPTAHLVLIQIGFSAVLTWFLLLRHHEIEFDLHLMGAFSLGLLHPGLSNAVGLVGLANVTASLSTVIWALEAILTMLVAVLVLRERLRPVDGLLSCIAVGGVCVISFGTQEVAGDGSILGAAQTLFAVLGCAVHAVLSRYFTAASKMSLLLVLAGQQTVGLVYCALVLPFHWSFADFANLGNIDAQSWCLVLATGTTKFLVATGLYIAALTKLPAGRAGNYLILTPIFGLIAASAVLSEQFGTQQWLGAALALLSVALVQFRSWKFQ